MFICRYGGQCGISKCLYVGVSVCRYVGMSVCRRDD